LKSCAIEPKCEWLSCAAPGGICAAAWKYPRSSPPVWLAILCGGLGHIDRAFGYLEQAIEQHNDQVCFMGVDHRFDELRHDPRFPVLMTRIGLPLALLPSAQ
jgi:hypothetical protein